MAMDFPSDTNTSPILLREGLDRALLREDPLEDLAEALVESCLTVTEVTCAWIWHSEVAAGKLNLAAVGQVDAALIDNLLALPAHPPLLRALARGRQVQEDWAQVLGAASGDFRATGLAGVTLVPAVIEGNLECVLGLGRQTDGPLPEDLLEVLTHATHLYGWRNRVARAENRLGRIRDNAVQVFQALQDVIFIVDDDSAVLATNHPGPADTEMGRLDAVLPGGSKILENHRDGLLVGATPGSEALTQSRLRSREGHLVPVEVTLKEINWNEKPAFMLVCRDIAQRLIIEKERERMYTAIEQTADAVMITNSSGSILYTNPAFTALTGYSAEEVYGANPRFLKSGRQSRNFYRAMWASIRRGETWQGRMENRRKDGQPYWEEATISPVLDTSGVITHFVGVKRDITQDVQREEKRRQSQKLEAIGTLAGGIAHDFNNILYALLGNAHLALDDIAEDHPAYLPLTEIVKAGDRGANLVTKMLAFGQRREGGLETRPLQPIIHEAMDLVRASLPSTIEFVLDLPERAAFAVVDDTHIHQVLLNLFNNAAHAMGGQGTCTLRLSEVTINAASPETDAGVVPGDYHRLDCHDTGIGMDENVQARIFEPYFTTKKAHEGTGLGLASVHGIVLNHKGHITVKSAPGEGTMFSIFLPKVAEGTAPEEEASPPSERVEGRGRVLVIDDEQMIVDVVQRGLSKAGFQVTAFTDGIKAVEFFRRDPQAFDVVLTDQTMPNITGFELATEVSSIRPDLPIVLTTGYAETMGETDMKSAGITHFQHKPLRIRELARLVSEICEPLTTVQGV